MPHTINITLIQQWVKGSDAMTKCMPINLKYRQMDKFLEHKPDARKNRKP